MPANRRLLIWIAALLSGCALIFAIVVFNAVLLGVSFYILLEEFSPCGQRIGPIISSPERSHYAQIREHDCGAVDGFNTSVVLSRQYSLDDVDPAEPPRIEVFQGNVPPDSVDLFWASERRLIIRLSDRYRDHDVEFIERWDGINVDVEFAS